jgi:glycosyltransferase involved in cell wall biosynthesis
VRILHCIDSLAQGGAERQLSYLVEGLLRAGHEIDVAYARQGAYEGPLSEAGAVLHRIGEASAALQVRDLHRVVRSRRPDLMHTWLGRMHVIGGITARMTRCPQVFNERSVRTWDRGIAGALRQWIGGRAALLVANSESGANAWRSSRKGPVRVIRNGLSLVELTAAAAVDRAELEVSPDAELVLHAGRFDPVKNIELLARVIVSVLSARPRAVAICCGEGELLGWFRATLDQSGLGARCLTPGYRADVWALLKAADVFITTSHAEGHPNSVLEALACGCPVVLSDIRPHRECVPADAGFFFAPGSAAEAARAIAQTLDDREATGGRVARGREAVRSHSIEAMVSSFLQLYDNVLSSEDRS